MYYGFCLAGFYRILQNQMMFFKNPYKFLSSPIRSGMLVMVCLSLYLFVLQIDFLRVLHKEFIADTIELLCGMEDSNMPSEELEEEDDLIYFWESHLPVFSIDFQSVMNPVSQYCNIFYIFYLEILIPPPRLLA